MRLLRCFACLCVASRRRIRIESAKLPVLLCGHCTDDGRKVNHSPLLYVTATETVRVGKAEGEDNEEKKAEQQDSQQNQDDGPLLMALPPASSASPPSPLRLLCTTLRCITCYALLTPAEYDVLLSCAPALTTLALHAAGSLTPLLLSLRKNGSHLRSLENLNIDRICHLPC